LFAFPFKWATCVASIFSTTHSLRSLETRGTRREVSFSWSGDDDQEKSPALRVNPVRLVHWWFSFAAVSRQMKKIFLCDLCASSEWNERVVKAKSFFKGKDHLPILDHRWQLRNDKSQLRTIPKNCKVI
jgi:hypothetical protein